MIVDSLDSNNIDMSWNSLIEFSYALNGNYSRTEKNLYLCIGTNEMECIDEFCEFGATPLFVNNEGKLDLADGCYDLHDFFYNNILEVDEAIDTALELIFNQIHNEHLHGFIEMPQHLGGDKFYFRVNSLSI
jgi:hypothetical protein